MVLLRLWPLVKQGPQSFVLTEKSPRCLDCWPETQGAGEVSLKQKNPREHSEMAADKKAQFHD